jgi:hypothetical protein
VDLTEKLQLLFAFLLSHARQKIIVIFDTGQVQTFAYRVIQQLLLQEEEEESSQLFKLFVLHSQDPQVQRIESYTAFQCIRTTDEQEDSRSGGNTTTPT